MWSNESDDVNIPMYVLVCTNMHKTVKTFDSNLGNDLMFKKIERSHNYKYDKAS